MLNLKKTLAITAMSGALFSGVAHSAQNTTTFAVSMVITGNCLVVATPMVFAGAGLLSSSTDATSQVTATCTPGTAFDVGLDDGANDNAGQRRMTFGGNFIDYNLFTDSGRTTRWDDIGGTTTLGDDGSDLDGIVILDVYGQVPSQTSQPAGAYTDTITVTIDF